MFRRSLNLTTFEVYRREWIKSGPAILLALNAAVVAETRATYVLDLDFPREREKTAHKIRYEFIRDEKLGHAPFDFWLFVAGKTL
jgi:hypothetical protein